MKRLLLVTTSYPDLHEGQAAAGVFVQDFATELACQGVSVEVVAPAETANYRLEDGVNVRRFAVPRQPLSLLNLARPGDWSAIVETLASGSRAVMQGCDAARPDHILALWALPSGHWARQAAQRYRIPYSTWSLGSDIWALVRIPIVRTYLRRVLREAQHRFADGYSLATDVAKIANLPCEFLPSSRRLPASRNVPRRNQAPYRLGFLGRWHPNKGVDLMLDSLARLDEAAWARIEMVSVFGGGPLENLVRARCAQLVAQGRPVEVGGYLDRTEAVSLLARSDYWLLPSRIESIPVVFSDAMQMHCPLVATPVGDLPRLFAQYHCGELATAATPTAFAMALTRLLQHSPAVFRPGVQAAAEAFQVTRAAAALQERLVQECTPS